MYFHCICDFILLFFCFPSERRRHRLGSLLDGGMTQESLLFLVHNVFVSYFGDADPFVSSALICFEAPIPFYCVCLRETVGEYLPSEAV